MVDFGIGEIALASTLLSGAASAAGAAYSGAASSAAYQYQAGVAQMNSQIAKQNAAYETALGEQQAQMSGMKSRSLISQTRAMQGAGGLDVQSGSNAQVRDSAAQLAQYDQAVIRNNAARRAYGAEVEATQFDAQAALDRMSASTSLTAGYLGAASSILGAGSSFATKWMWGRERGMFG